MRVNANSKPGTNFQPDFLLPTNPDNEICWAAANRWLQACTSEHHACNTSVITPSS